MHRVRSDLFAIIVLVLLGVGWIVMRDGRLSVEGVSGPLSAAVSDNPVGASLAYVVLSLVGASFLALPGVLFALVAGAVFGPVWGTLLCWGSMSAGAVVSFVLGRYFLRDAVGPRLAQNRLLNRLLFSGAPRNDVFVLAVTRLVPIFPYNLQNYAYGVTDMALGRYAVFSTLFLLPGTMVYTLGAAGIVDEDVRVACIALSLVVLTATLGIAFVLRRKAGLDS